ncbi:hypothetical protein HHI36_015425, partial [Cryptolaemus montrouzieri]
MTAARPPPHVARFDLPDVEWKGIPALDRYFGYVARQESDISYVGVLAVRQFLGVLIQVILFVVPKRLRISFMTHHNASRGKEIRDIEASGFFKGNW